MDHPSFDELLASAEGHPLPPEVQSHVEACAPCARRLELIGEVLEVLPDLALEPVPDGVLRAALSTSESQSPLQRFLGKLLPASERGPVPALRGSDGGLQHLLYRAGPYEVDLARLENGSLAGQALPIEDETPELDEGRCYLHGQDASYDCELEPTGLFRFEPVVAGEYVLVVETSTARLVVPDLTLAED